MNTLVFHSNYVFFTVFIHFDYFALYHMPIHYSINGTDFTYKKGLHAFVIRNYIYHFMHYIILCITSFLRTYAYDEMMLFEVQRT